MYTPKHFTPQELVPPAEYSARGAAALELIDDRVLITLDQLRDKFGPMIINTWHSAKMAKAFGRRTESGLRTMSTTTGAKFSQHKYGRAADVIFTKVTAEEVRQYVLANPDEFPHITCIEANTSWFHFDVRNCERIKVVYP